MSIKQRPPLQGLKIVDLTTFLSGPSATQLLGDLGADVIKVEALTGDSSRAIAGPELDGDSAYFLANNRNKRSVAIDLKDPAGLAVIKKLIANADIVIENFRPGVTKRLGIDPEKLSIEHPALIWASISGFGQEGAQRDKPAYDMVVQALSGVMSLTGHEGAPAVRLGIPAGDVVAGLYAVIGILSALQARSTSGKGRVIDVSMLHGQLAMLSYQALYTMLKNEAPKPQGAAHDSIPTYRSFQAGDGREFVVTANTPRMWESLCQVLEVPELTTDPRFVDAPSRLANKHALWEILETQVLKRPADEWVRMLTEASVPVAPIKNVLEAIEDAREAADGSLLNIENGSTSYENVSTPIRFVETEEVPAKYPPKLGEDTISILTHELGISSLEVVDLIEKGVVGVPENSIALSRGPSLA
ncbi:MAG: CaiB/BaiF CoA transferase family protein [Gulosibacter sp.]|uniref:CaiB/BaiF CoA transferase family protein n=1 Tax=Gulosibacter sp. TaxID=2817531 RepID=UPI003F8DD830